MKNLSFLILAFSILFVACSKDDASIKRDLITEDWTVKQTQDDSRNFTPIDSLVEFSTKTYKLCSSSALLVKISEGSTNIVNDTINSVTIKSYAVTPLAVYTITSEIINLSSAVCLQPIFSPIDSINCSISY